MPAFRRKLRSELDEAGRREALDMAGAIAAGLRGYAGVTTLMSLPTGVARATWAWAWATGVELAPTRGVLDLLRDFVPVVGDVSPSRYEPVRFGGWTTPLAVFPGYAARRAVVGDVVARLAQGRGLSPPPPAVVAALAYWGRLWASPARRAPRRSPSPPPSSAAVSAAPPGSLGCRREADRSWRTIRRVGRARGTAAATGFSAGAVGRHRTACA